jgi:hypothetical protein
MEVQQQRLVTSTEHLIFSISIARFIVWQNILPEVGHLKAGPKDHRHCLDVLASKHRDPTSLFALCPTEGRPRQSGRRERSA